MSITRRPRLSSPAICCWPPHPSDSSRWSTKISIYGDTTTAIATREEAQRRVDQIKLFEQELAHLQADRVIYLDDSQSTAIRALELDGHSHEHAVSQACSPASSMRDGSLCEFELKKASRLYVTDAGHTVAELRARYPNRNQFAIVSGVIKISHDPGALEPVGYVSGLSVETIQGSEPVRSAIDPSTGDMLWHRVQFPHHFDAVIAFGRRLEPWNVSVEFRR